MKLTNLTARHFGIAVALIAVAGCRLNLGPSADFSSGGLTREPAENPLSAGKPLVLKQMSNAVSCGGTQLEPETVRVEATEQQLCVTKNETVTRSAGAGLSAMPKTKGLKWELVSDTAKTALFSLEQGAPTERGWCTEASYARPDEARGPNVQADAYGRLVKSTPVQVTQYTLKACVPNTGVLSPASRELALRLQASGASDFADVGAWTFSPATAPR